MKKQESVAIGWCRDIGRVEQVARFFVTYAGASYISHSELQSGRAVAPNQWSGDLHANISAYAQRAIARENGSRSLDRLALATLADAIVGVAFVSLTAKSQQSFAVLEDLLIHPAARRKGVGKALLHWIGDECRREGARRLYLESGVGNHQAHRFFAAHGFKKISIMMMQDL